MVCVWVSLEEPFMYHYAIFVRKGKEKGYAFHIVAMLPLFLNRGKESPRLKELVNPARKGVPELLP